MTPGGRTMSCQDSVIPTPQFPRHAKISSGNMRRRNFLSLVICAKTEEPKFLTFTNITGNCWSHVCPWLGEKQAPLISWHNNHGLLSGSICSFDSIIMKDEWRGNCPSQRSLNTGSLSHPWLTSNLSSLGLPNPQVLKSQRVNLDLEEAEAISQQSWS